MIVNGDLTPVPLLLDAALQMCGDLTDQLQQSETDERRYWLCHALSSAESLAARLMAHGGDLSGRWRTPGDIMRDLYGRVLSPGAAGGVYGRT